MRVLKYVLVIGCFFLALAGCKEKQLTTVSFEIRDYDGMRPRVVMGHQVQIADIDSLTGKGSVMLDLSETRFAEIYIGKHNTKLVYLEPGKELSLNYGLAKGDQEVVFGGELAEENKYLYRKNVYVPVPRGGFFEKDMPALVRRQDSALRVNQQRLSETTFSKEFKELENMRLKVNTLLALAVTSAVDQEAYLQVMRERFVDDGAYLRIPAYAEMLDQYVIRKLLRMWTPADSTLSEMDRKVACILEHVKDPAVVGHLVDQVLFVSAEQGMQKYRDIYRQYVKDPVRLAAFAEACKKGDRIMPGNPCPDFTFKDVNDKEVSLSDLKGKYVYIDLWATWCGPCKGEIPSLLKLEERLAGKDITFVGISVDRNKDIETWKQAVKELKLEGIQLHLGENWDWIKIFMPASLSVPRFILLDREGKIIDANMSRPSDRSTLGRLESLLK